MIMELVHFDYKTKFNELLSFLDGSSKCISIIVHKNPDGDALCSGLALSMWLQKRSYDVRMIVPNCYSDNFLWLPNGENIIIYDSIFKTTAIEHIKKSSITFFLDFSQTGRIDESLISVVTESGCKVGIIDHHLEEPQSGDFTCWNLSAASTSEIVYELLSFCDQEIDNNIATCLYTGIVTDTGRFMTANMTYRVHEIAANLLRKYDIDIQGINKSIYGSNRLSRLRFLGYVLSRCLKTINGYKVAYVALSQDDFKKFIVRPGDTDGIVNYALSVKDIILAALLNEKKDGIYISLRSVGDFSVNDMAKTYFNGGGHRNASGGILKTTLEEAVTNFSDIIKQFDVLKI